MKKAYRAMADFLLPAIVFAAIFSTFAAAALCEKIGGRMETEKEDFSQMEDTRVVEALCQRKPPVICHIGKKRWEVGEILLISQAFAAIDAEGRALDVRVSDIVDEDGGSVPHCFEEETGRAIFSQRGVYTFFLQAMDKERKTSVKKISILVDSRRGEGI